MDWIIFIVVSWVAADFVSGVIHWAEDRYAREGWPVIGPLIAIPNIVHHNKPQAFLEGSYWHRNYTTIVPAFAAMLLCLCFAATRDWWLTLLFLSQANEIHAWAHQQGKLNPVITILQDMGVLQSPRQHAEHHRSPHMVCYCVMSNWLNPALDAIQFWDGIEYVLRIFGAQPRN